MKQLRINRIEKRSKLEFKEEELKIIILALRNLAMFYSIKGFNDKENNVKDLIEGIENEM